MLKQRPAHALYFVTNGQQNEKHSSISNRQKWFMPMSEVVFGEGFFFSVNRPSHRAIPVLCAAHAISQ
jgi:hypothetical protein